MSKLPADFCFASAVAITRAIGERSVSCTQIMEAHLARIEAVNPKLNAVVARLRGRRDSRRQDEYPGADAR
jgi:amidase